MRYPGLLFAVLPLLLVLPGSARAQYMFLDANRDTIADETDRIDLSGITIVDIWLDTSRNRDGTPASCGSDPSTPLAINSWEVVLRAIGGTIEWGPLDNVLPLSTVRACFADASDTTDPVWYHNGWGGRIYSDPGRHHLGRLRVRALTGEPSIAIWATNPNEPTDATSFGTRCPGPYEDYTYRYGESWFDADGIGSGLLADAGGPYLGTEGIPIRFDASATISASGRPLSYAWDFGDGSQGMGPAPSHAYASAGEYRVVLTVLDGEASSNTWTTARVLAPMPPVAQVGGPYSGFVGISIFFDGRGSSDENGDPLRYWWSFGDSLGAEGAYAYHAYAARGVFRVRLTVSDGTFFDSDETNVYISDAPQRPPVADAGGPYRGYAGVLIRFDGGGSRDPDGDPLTYRWLFGDAMQSTLRSPVYAYAEPGVYEVILELSDGTYTVSDATEAVVEPTVGSPPIASAGGPYEAIAGEAIQLDGSRSSDADGDPLEYVWRWGDLGSATGPRPMVTFRASGQFPVTLQVNDGVHAVEASTTARVASRWEARAWLPPTIDEIALGAWTALLQARLESRYATFLADQIDLSRVALAAVGLGREIVAAYAVPGGDTDGNGIAEIVAAFRPDDVKRLLEGVERPGQVALEIRGWLLSGDRYRAALPVRVVPGTGRFAAVVRPNPFNPQALVTFTVARPGLMRADLFDLRGRLVKTVLRERSVSAGTHEVAIDARGDDGAMLASGVYFLRVAGPDGPVTTRVAITK